MRLTTLALLAATALQGPAHGQARLDAAAAARAECERKLGVPQIAGTGDPVREQQISACVQQTLRERQPPTRQQR
jgi:hypothetical protein